MAFCADGIRNENGKRERSDHEDDPEFMPLSKRINNIHLSPERMINGTLSNPGFSNPNHNYHPNQQHQHPPTRLPTPHVVNANPNASPNPASNVNVPGLYEMGGGEHPANTNQFENIEYRPALNQTANPHYYEANRALFNLYIERQLRNNLQPHPNVIGRPPNLGSSHNIL